MTYQEKKQRTINLKYFLQIKTTYILNTKKIGSKNMIIYIPLCCRRRLIVSPTSTAVRINDNKCVIIAFCKLKNDVYNAVINNCDNMMHLQIHINKQEMRLLDKKR